MNSKVLNYALSKIGLLKSKETPMPAAAYGWPVFFSFLTRHGFSPRCILDVGANRGNWTRSAIKYFPAASYVLVEPQDYLRAHIQDLISEGYDLRWVAAGVSDRPGVLPLTIAPNDVSSSFLPSAELASAIGCKQVLIEVKTINEIVANCGHPYPEIVKIDAEGYDLKALAGASNLFGKTDIFFVEAAVCATLIENTVAAVVTRMEDAGYKMIDITDINRSPKNGALWLCELAFMRIECPLLKNITSYQ